MIYGIGGKAYVPLGPSDEKRRESLDGKITRFNAIRTHYLHIPRPMSYFSDLFILRVFTSNESQAKDSRPHELDRRN